MKPIIQNKKVDYQNIDLQNIDLQKLSKTIDDTISLIVKRIDKVHPLISGNKCYKLKYNLLEARRLGYTQLLSFGGAYSNHIHALAHASQEYGFDSIGIIRGDELAGKPLNNSLQQSKDVGMIFEFISRKNYRLKHTPEYLEELQARYPNAYIIPEGGTNALAVKGCEEILSPSDKENFDIIVCAVGTGSTLSGIINASGSKQQVIGFSALKGNFLTEAVETWADASKQGGNRNWQIYSEDTFGGYARYNDELLVFIKQVNEQCQLPLEPIYTGKAMYRLLGLIKQQQIAPDSRILFIHTGGLQAFSS